MEALINQGIEAKKKPSTDLDERTHEVAVNRLRLQVCFLQCCKSTPRWCAIVVENNALSQIHECELTGVRTIQACKERRQLLEVQLEARRLTAELAQQKLKELRRREQIVQVHKTLPHDPLPLLLPPIPLHTRMSVFSSFPFHITVSPFSPISPLLPFPFPSSSPLSPPHRKPSPSSSHHPNPILLLPTQNMGAAKGPIDRKDFVAEEAPVAQYQPAAGESLCLFALLRPIECNRTAIACPGCGGYRRQAGRALAVR